LTSTSTLPLLVLLRLSPATHAPALFLQLRQRLVASQGHVLDYTDDMAIWFCPQPNEVFDILDAFLAQGAKHNFWVRACAVQAIVATQKAVDSCADFTELTIRTLFELSSVDSDAPVVISPKLLSLLKLAAPQAAKRFDLLACKTTQRPVAAMGFNASASVA
jgi:hypothetical protein